MRDEKKSWRSEPESYFPLPLKERIRMAREHMEQHEQQHDALWPYQRFALTISELLAAAERGA